jgi:lysosomal Pro-X carboxypeptidase
LEKDPSYLSIEQALADFATLIYHVKDKYDAHGSAVIAFGGSYGGMLAAWLRKLYPHAVQV